MKRKTTYMLMTILALLAMIVIWIVNLPAFGKMPSGARLERIRKLPNYTDCALDNLSPTPVKPDSVSYWDMLKMALKGNDKSSPDFPLPTRKPDFSAKSGTKITWFGHSSYFIQVNGLNILVDPVFSPRTSPISFIGTKQFEGTDIVQPEDFPELDILLITHDHYDHLDYQSILKLKGRTKRFITSLGVGAHLEYWGVPAENITELAWNEETTAGPLTFTAVSARHFSGRLLKRNQTVWSAFILQTSNSKLYLGGDSGYDTHFKTQGEKYGPFDIALLECGQYNDYWPLIHMSPEQTVQAAVDLRAKVLLPVHWGKFKLAMHDWNEPIIRVVKKAKEENLKITTPVIGESVILGESYPSTEWWAIRDSVGNN